MFNGAECRFKSDISLHWYSMPSCMLFDILIDSQSTGGNMNLDHLPVIRKDGPRTDHEIMVFALSTCGFCKRALAFLDSHGFSYRYLHVDLIPVEEKNKIKQELKERFSENVAFPFAVIDNDRHLVGFIEADWRLTLGVQS